MRDFLELPNHFLVRIDAILARMPRGSALDVLLSCGKVITLEFKSDVERKSFLARFAFRQKLRTARDPDYSPAHRGTGNRTPSFLLMSLFIELPNGAFILLDAITGIITNSDNSSRCHLLIGEDSWELGFCSKTDCDSYILKIKELLLPRATFLKVGRCSANAATAGPAPGPAPGVPSTTKEVPQGNPRYTCLLPRDNLPDDPKAALLEIAKYIVTVETKGRTIPPGIKKYEVPQGYWQDAGWWDGLMWLGAEALRIGEAAPGVPPDLKP